MVVSDTETRRTLDDHFVQQMETTIFHARWISVTDRIIFSLQIRFDA